MRSGGRSRRRGNTRRFTSLRFGTTTSGQCRPTSWSCALFAALHGKNTQYLRDEYIACINGYTVTYTGILRDHASRSKLWCRDGGPIVVPARFVRLEEERRERRSAANGKSRVPRRESPCRAGLAVPGPVEIS
jgi:hypothetical protein